MRHRKAGVKLGRTSSHRKAMFRNMVTSLFKYERIRTTNPKAKALRGWADHLITLAKRGDLHARRQALAIVREKDVVHKLFEEAPERYGKIKGGYTRIIKLGHRPGDAAPVSMIELVNAKDITPKNKTKQDESLAEEVKAAATEAVEKTADSAAETTSEDESGTLAEKEVEATPEAETKSEPELEVKKEAE